MNLNIVCIPGDGIGPEIVSEAKRYLIKQQKNLIIPFLIKIY